MDNDTLTRRAFVALAASTVLPASTAKIRTAVVGTGHGHALSKIRALRSMPEYDLVGVCRPDGEPQVDDDLRDVPAVSVEEVLADTSIEMVAIEAADPDRNLKFAEQFVHAGRFVHLDKPPGSDLERFRKLLAEAAGQKRVVQMGYQCGTRLPCKPRLKRLAMVGSAEFTGSVLPSISWCWQRSGGTWQNTAAA
jgi:predicted dehydrogenase